MSMTAAETVKADSTILPNTPDAVVPETVIEARAGWRLVDWRELREYRDLFYFLTWRDIKARYAQSVLGIGWAVIQPVFSMLVFTIIFGNLARLSSDGVPYAIFSFTALVPWTFFSSAMTGATNSLMSNQGMLTKIYFPRLILPMSAVLGKAVDFAISLVLLFGMMAWFRVVPTWGALFLPVIIVIMAVASAGVGMWLTAMSIQYRDIRYGLNFGVQLLMYAAPVVYSVSIIPERYLWAYALNPMVGVIEGFRAALLGTRAMPWDLIAVGGASAAVLSITGALYFRRMERKFADLA